VVDDSRADAVMQRLAALNDARPKLGLRAFLWTIDQTV
jgi:hypothetical protein